MHVVIIIILLLCIMNTILLMKHMHKFDKYHYKEGYFPVGPTDTRFGPYEGITSCSGYGVRVVRNPNVAIGDDSSIFYGQDVKLDKK